MPPLIKETLQIHSILHDETNTPPTHTIRSITAYKYNNLQIHYTHLNKQKLTTHIKNIHTTTDTTCLNIRKTNKLTEAT